MVAAVVGWPDLEVASLCETDASRGPCRPRGCAGLTMHVNNPENERVVPAHMPPHDVFVVCCAVVSVGR